MGGGRFPYEICGLSSIIYHIIIFPIPIFFGTRYIWFEKSSNSIFNGLFDRLKSLLLPLQELWQNHHDPTHAAYGIGGLIVLFIIYNRLLIKFWEIYHNVCFFE